MAQSEDASHKSVYVWDNLSRLSSHTKTDGQLGNRDIVFGYNYDLNNNLTLRSQIIGSEAAVTTTWEYDGQDRVDRIIQTGTEIADKSVEIDYNDDHTRDTVRRYTGTTLQVVTTYAYDDAGRETSIRHRDAVGTLLNRHDVTLDRAGYVLELDNHLDSQGTSEASSEFAYDATGQLETADHLAAAVQDETYQYDLNGNRHRHGRSQPHC